MTLLGLQGKLDREIKARVRYAFDAEPDSAAIIAPHSSALELRRLQALTEIGVDSLNPSGNAVGFAERGEGPVAFDLRGTMPAPRKPLGAEGRVHDRGGLASLGMSAYTLSVPIHRGVASRI